MADQREPKFLTAVSAADTRQAYDSAVVADRETGGGVLSDLARSVSQPAEFLAG